MAYKIQYVPDPSRQPRNTYLRWQALTAACLLIFLLLVHLFWDQGSAVIRNYLLPETGKTYTALVTLVDELEEGNGILEAVNAFCCELIYGAG